MEFDFQKNFFELFGLPERYELDTDRLDRAYREVQTQVHPDRFADASEGQRRLSMQWATLANEAYRTLKNPLERAKYLLKIRGADVQEETNTAMSPQFLMAQMELREAIGDARRERDAQALTHVEGSLKSESRKLYESLHHKLDVEEDLEGAVQIVRELRFLQKLRAEIDQAYETMEN